MIRALIGRFLLHCIEREKRRRIRAEIRGLDFATLADWQISDLVHGRALDVSRPVFVAPKRPHVPFGRGRS